MGLPTRQANELEAHDHTKGKKAINPSLVLAFRFLITALVCGLALATAIMAILVVVYYNTHNADQPSWGSLIFIIVLGFFTGFIYIGYNMVMPIAPFINYGDFLYGLYMVKIELLLQFAMTVLWIVGALAYAVDLGGYENCQFDGYDHNPKPADFHHVCDLTNWVIPLAWSTAGVQVFLWLAETAFGLYTFLYLDQESFNEPMFEWGRRAYNWQNGKDHNGHSTQPQYRARVDQEAQPGGRRGLTTDDEMHQTNGQNATLGARGRRGATYGDDDHVLNDEDESGWHLRA